MKTAKRSIMSLRFVIWLFLVALISTCGILLILANRIPSRVAPAGIVWEKRDQNSGDEFDKPDGVFIAPSGDIVLFGSGRILKCDESTGEARWRIASNANVLAIDSHGDIYAAGSEVIGYKNGPISPPFGGYHTNIVLCKYTGKDGKLIWKQSYGGRHNDMVWVRGIALDSSGNPVIAGFSPDDSRYYSYCSSRNTPGFAGVTPEV